MKKRRNHLNSERSGGTLIEVMIAAVILTIIATGAAAMLYLSRSTINMQSNKHIALAEAIRIMELITETHYLDIRPPTPAPDVYYLDENITLQTSTPNWDVNIRGIHRPVLVEIQRVNTTAPVTNEYLSVKLALEYRQQTGGQINLRTDITSPQ